MPQLLLLTRRFAPLFWCQFFAAFNDNLLKNSLVLLVLFKIGGEQSASLVTLAGVLFIAPYFILSALGGQLADKFEKSLVAKRLKLVEIAAAGVAAFGFHLGSIPLLFLALIMFGALGALFGPVKYGILPESLTREELPVGNALVETATFIAILLGTVVGGAALSETGENGFLAFGMIGFAALSYAAACFIPSTPRAEPDIALDPNILRSTLALLRELWADTRLWRLGVVTSVNWMIGAIAMSLLPTLVVNTMQGSQEVATTHLGVFAVAVGLGSGLAAFLLHGKILLLPTALGAGLAALACLDLGASLAMHEAATEGVKLQLAEYFAQPGAWRALLDLAALSIACALIGIPSFVALQAFSKPSARARVVAAVNVMNAAAMVFGGVIVAGLQGLGAPIWALFLGVAFFVAIAAVWIWRRVVDQPMQDALAILFGAIYRTETKGLEHLAAAGANPIIALNHVSFLDALIAASILPREPLFAIDKTIAEAWWVKPFLKFARAVPLDPTKPMGTRTLVNAVRSGESLVIFPEGRLTVTGSLMKVYDGAGLIADKCEAMVVPVRIEGPETTIFSRLSKTQVRRRLFPKFKVTVLKPVRLSVDPNLKGKARRHAAGAQLYQIMSDLVFRTMDADRTLFQAVLDAARQHGPSSVALEDPMSGRLSYRKLLIGARALGQQLTDYVAPGETVGLMAPNANGAAVAFLALSSAGCTPAMVNFTAGPTNILAGLKAVGANTVVTSRAFIEKGRMEGLVAALEEKAQLIYLEDLRDQVTTFDRLSAMLAYARPIARGKPDEMATILFTSGSEGTPKGVALSHKNLMANVAQASARIDFSRQDKVFNALPVFHCFGLTIGFILPLVSGVPIFFYPSPLHYRIVPELVYGSNATILFGTDTFLSGYARAAHAYDFRSIRYVLAGAEPVKDSTRAIWMEKFGLRILEGYGVTEAAPALALNTPMHNKFGTVGRLLPGVERRLAPIAGVEDGGRLFVSGPNVMMGYLRVENPGVLERPADGWHDTGDIVTIDAEGFLTIKGRAKRFAKIGGEMVSLAAIEGLAAQLWPQSLSAAATELDPRKGERIILLTQERSATRADFQSFAKSKGASELMTPAEIMIVDRLPLLGSGKLDFAAVTKMALDRRQASLSVQRTPNGLGRIDGDKLRSA